MAKAHELLRLRKNGGLFLRYALALAGVYALVLALCALAARMEASRTATARLHRANDAATDFVEHTADAFIAAYLSSAAERGRAVAAFCESETADGNATREQMQTLAADLLRAAASSDGVFLCAAPTGGGEPVAAPADPALAQAAEGALRRWRQSPREGLREFETTGPERSDVRTVAVWTTRYEPWGWVIVAGAWKDALARRVNWEEIGRDLLFQPIGDAERSFILDGSGAVVTHPDFAPGENLAERFDWAARMREERAGDLTYRTEEPGGEDDAPPTEMLAVFRRATGLDWIVVSIAARDGAARTAQDSSRLLLPLFAILLALLLAAFGAWCAMLHGPLTRSQREVERTIQTKVEARTREIEREAADLRAKTEQQERTLREDEETIERLSARIGDLRQLSREMASLNEMADLLQACRTEEETYGVIAKLAGALFPNDSGALCRYCEEEGLLETVAEWGDDLRSRSDFVLDDCWALRRGKVYALEQEDSDLVCGHLSATPPHGYLCLPMMPQGELLGMLHLEFGPPSPGASEQEAKSMFESRKRLAATVTEQFGLALANLNLREILRAQSIRDQLTGLFNRRYMEESLVREIHRAQRHEKPLAVIMLDVDHFKRFNDTHGHEKGDIVLQELGALILNLVRQEDVACRYGGEEFLIILPGAPLDIARERAEELRRKVRDKIKVAQQMVTISLGVAVYPDNGLTQEALLSSADGALYQAKNEGRDRVIVASDGA